MVTEYMELKKKINQGCAAINVVKIQKERFLN